MILTRMIDFSCTWKCAAEGKMWVEGPAAGSVPVCPGDSLYLTSHQHGARSHLRCPLLLRGENKSADKSDRRHWHPGESLERQDQQDKVRPQEEAEQSLQEEKGRAGAGAGAGALHHLGSDGGLETARHHIETHRWHVWGHPEGDGASETDFHWRRHVCNPHLRTLEDC